MLFVALVALVAVVAPEVFDRVLAKVREEERLRREDSVRQVLQVLPCVKYI